MKATAPAHVTGSVLVLRNVSVEKFLSLSSCQSDNGTSEKSVANMRKREAVEMGISPVRLPLMSQGVLHSQSSLSPVMGSNDTCRTLRHYNEPVAVKLKGVDSQLDTDQCLFL